MRTLCSLIVGLVFLAGCNNKDNDTPTAPTQGAVIALAGNLSFGSVAAGSTATATLTINNTGNTPLTITSIGYPAGFSGNFASGTIPAGGSQAVTVTFAPTAAQSYSGTVTVNGDHRSGTNTIAASGTGFTVATFTLSGQVTETPPTTSTVLAGVRVAFVDGANAGKSATTGANGRPQVVDGSVSLDPPDDGPANDHIGRHRNTGSGGGRRTVPSVGTRYGGTTSSPSNG